MSALFFSCKKTTFLEFFSHHCLPVLWCHPYLFLEKKLTTLFARHFHSVHSCISRTFFYLSDLLGPLFFVSLCKNFFFPSGVTPWRLSPGAIRPHHPPSPTPPCDATEYCNTLYTEIARESTCSCGLVSLLN